MTLLRSSHCKSLLLLIAFSLLLSACNRAGLAYRNLDWLVPWRLNDYLHLTKEQQAWLKPRLQAHLQWHCSVELPLYLDWLQDTQGLLLQAQPDSAALLGQLAEFDAAVKRVGREVTPTAIELLRGLDERQIGELVAAMEEDNQEDRQDFLDPPLADQIAERSERMEERLRPWLGRLDAQQKAHVADWATYLGEQNRLWLENRWRWQAELRDALAQRSSAEFPAQVTRLLQARDSFHDAEYQRAYPRAQQALAELFAKLLRSADATQRERLAHRLRDLRRDLGEQVCSANSSASGANG
ncbi:DUF6279 family lipoprotein [Pseudomonas borbori]